MTFESAEVPFESYEDLDKSNFEIYTVDSYIEKKILDNPHLKRLLQRIHLTNNLRNCFHKLITDKDVICINHENFIYEMIKINQKYEHAVIKFGTPSLFGDNLKFYVLEKASPFGDMFGKILLRTQEARLETMESLMRGFDVTTKIDDPEIKFDEIDVRQLLLILFCGYFLGILTFFAEFITFKLTWKPPKM